MGSQYETALLEILNHWRLVSNIQSQSSSRTLLPWSDSKSAPSWSSERVQWELTEPYSNCTWPRFHFSCAGLICICLSHVSYSYLTNNSIGQKVVFRCLYSLGYISVQEMLVNNMPWLSRDSTLALTINYVLQAVQVGRTYNPHRKRRCCLCEHVHCSSDYQHSPRWICPAARELAAWIVLFCLQKVNLWALLPLPSKTEPVASGKKPIR